MNCIKYLITLPFFLGLTFAREPETYIQFKDVYDDGSGPPSIKNTFRIVVDECEEFEEGEGSLICDYSIQHEAVQPPQKALNINPFTGIHFFMDMEASGSITAGLSGNTVIDDGIVTGSLDATNISASNISAEDITLFDMGENPAITITGGAFGWDANIKVGDDTDYVSASPDAIYVNDDDSYTMIDANSVSTGRVITKKWRVQPADYVFEPDYALPSLDKVESYVKEHKHLPEIPSGKEMKEKGLDLGTMNIMLLKKVEELTLYTIEQEKKLKNQQERMDRLEQYIKGLQKRNQGEHHE